MWQRYLIRQPPQRHRGCARRRHRRLGRRREPGRLCFCLSRYPAQRIREITSGPVIVRDSPSRRLHREVSWLKVQVPLSLRAALEFSHEHDESADGPNPREKGCGGSIHSLSVLVWSKVRACATTLQTGAMTAFFHPRGTPRFLTLRTSRRCPPGRAWWKLPPQLPPRPPPSALRCPAPPSPAPQAPSTSARQIWHALVRRFRVAMPVALLSEAFLLLTILSCRVTCQVSRLSEADPWCAKAVRTTALCCRKGCEMSAL